MNNQGQVALPFVLLISGVIIEIAIAGAFVAYFLSTSSLGERLSIRAYSASYAGIEDAMIKIIANKEFTTASCASVYNYSLTVDSDSTSIDVCRTTQSAANSYTYTITSLATASSRKKKLQAVLNVNKTTGEANLQSITDVPAS